jgi:hypothetical protein
MKDNADGQFLVVDIAIIDTSSTDAIRPPSDGFDD